MIRLKGETGTKEDWGLWGWDGGVEEGNGKLIKRREMGWDESGENENIN